MLNRLRDNKICLETAYPCDAQSIVKGVVRVVNLDFHNVCFLESEFEEFGLGMGKNTYNTAVFLYAVESLSDVVLVFGLILCESLVLGSHPVSVEPSLA